jgi:hypothetical protein
MDQKKALVRITSGSNEKKNLHQEQEGSTVQSAYEMTWLRRRRRRRDRAP